MNGLILITDIVEKFVMLGLMSLSIWSGSIIIERFRFWKREIHPKDLEALRKDILSSDLEELPRRSQKYSSKFIAGFLSEAIACRHQSIDILDRRVASYFKHERSELEKGLNILATLGANAPFLGLFGTVLGIIRSFAYLGTQAGSSAVMSGVSQALYATALGLFVALPAVVFYNVFIKKAKELSLQADSIKDLLVSKILMSQEAELQSTSTERK